MTFARQANEPVDDVREPIHSSCSQHYVCKPTTIGMKSWNPRDRTTMGSNAPFPPGAFRQLISQLDQFLEKRSGNGNPVLLDTTKNVFEFSGALTGGSNRF
ncbi:MAG: hypothetical protein KDA80_00620 [Planctomycetaceae bacterium]|nr:hypothetical protein [Planctomycetaceae bacterium]